MVRFVSGDPLGSSLTGMNETGVQEAWGEKNDGSCWSRKRVSGMEAGLRVAFPACHTPFLGFTPVWWKVFDSDVQNGTSQDPNGKKTPVCVFETENRSDSRRLISAGMMYIVCGFIGL